MKRVYECEMQKKGELNKIISADPYSPDSFTRVDCRVKEGSFLEQDKAKLYVYLSAADDFFKKAEEKLKGVVERCKPEVEEAIIKRITDEDEQAQSGMGAIFG